MRSLLGDMKLQHDALYGTGATFLVTLAGLEAFAMKLLTSVIVASVSAVAVHFVRKGLQWLEKRKA